MEKHTPRPWKIAEQIEVEINGIRTSFDSVQADDFIAGGGIALVHRKIAASNSALIAAAPDLLDAAKFSLSVLHGVGFNDDEVNGICGILIAAIAKAEKMEAPK